jgi:uncharacterized membrane protein
MAKVKRSIKINEPVEKVFEYLLDHKNESEWMPGMVEVTDSTGNGIGEQYKWTYKMAGVLLKGETTVTELEPNKRIRTLSKGGIKSDFLFVLERQNGGTLLELVIEYTVPIPVLGKLAEKAILKRNEREADLAMQNIKDSLEV